MSQEGAAAFYSHDNFILGSSEPATIFLQSDCCRLSISVNIQDIAGNSQLCQLKSTREKESSLLLSTAGIAAVVVIVILLLIIGVAVGFILYSRHKRSVDLEEMRVKTTQS